MRLDEMKKAIEEAGYRVMPPPNEKKELLTLSGMTLREVADKSGVSVPRVCRWSRGELELRAEQVRSVNAVLMDGVRRQQARMAAIVGGCEKKNHEPVAV